MYPSISTNELKGLVGKVNIIDLRDSINYNIGHIPTSRNINYLDLIINPNNYISKDSKYYLYCTYGYNSAKTCLSLSKRGFNVINVIGGYNSYLNN